MITIKLKGVTAELKRVQQASAKEQARGVQAVARHMVEDLKKATPVDTGLARDSWRVVDQPSNLSTPAVVVNDQPYIANLNEGSSAQAPAHFIERSVLRHGRAAGQVVEVVEDLKDK